ncbi:MAG TPA: polyphenol oxidase family protein [Gaiellaceae bacterium]|nr:polyphenol oxidase family protein [Gaiellaceae bacterium]
MIRWEAPGPYVVAFTTRTGGVSDGPFASLNLGGRADDPDRIAENRRLVCESLGLDASRLAVNRQEHSATSRKAQPGVQGTYGDALWTDEPGLPMLALSADCLPIAVATTAGRPALAVIHAGWRGLSAGVVEAAVQAIGAGPKAAAIGPAVGPCCYEVGPEVSELFDADLTEGRMLNLWAAAERALKRAGVERVERLGLCTSCNPDLFFSHRRDGATRGVQGVIGALTA